MPNKLKLLNHSNIVNVLSVHQLQHGSPKHAVEVLYLHLDSRGAGAGGTMSNDNEFVESFSSRVLHAVAVGK
jgi:hypothetical protein